MQDGGGTSLTELDYPLWFKEIAGEVLSVGKQVLEVTQQACNKWAQKAVVHPSKTSALLYLYPQCDQGRL